MFKFRSRPKDRKDGWLARLNRAATEVGIEHFDDDRDWDARVKLPEWQLARLKQRYAAKKAAKGRLGKGTSVET
jgi:hypothetical protein